MLNSVRFQCRASKRLMPNYGRIKKINKSMNRLMSVWNNRAELKLKNKEAEQDREYNIKRDRMIENRRKIMLEKREKIKELFIKHITFLKSRGLNTAHIMPKKDNSQHLRRINQIPWWK